MAKNDLDRLRKNSLLMEESIYFANPNVYKAKRFFKNLLLYLLLIIQGLIVILPFYIMILTSAKSSSSFQGSVETFEWWVPLKDAIENIKYNYVNAYQKINFGRSMLNTILVASIGTLGTVFTTVLAAYAFGRLNFKGKNILFALFMTTMMVPGEMFIITNYITVSKWGWVGMGQTYTKAILCETIPFMTSIFYIYYLRQTFMTVPNELYYAAKVDGTTDLKYLFKVMIPIASGTIISITILNAMSSWNAYIWPALVTDVSNKDYQLVTAALRQASFTVGNVTGGLPDYAGQMAAAFMVTIPLLVVFFALKKYIMRGVSRSGIKG